ncbi:MAG: MFS transporter, partial [Planctomycetota bacterium]|nr:MFS transporter [Planctomycetota bacterium]
MTASSEPISDNTPDNYDAESASTDMPRVDRRGGLTSRSFVGLLITQFLGAINDNMFRWLVVPIGKDMVGPEHTATALSVGLACFVLPYLLLAAPAGYLADRFSKRRVIVACKVAEIVVMSLGIAAIAIGNLYLMFIVVALMGAQSALFGPSKLGSIPEIVHDRCISAANALVGLT